MRQYHFSYDTIDCEKHFTDYEEAKRYLLCVLWNTPIIKIESFTESTFILTYYIKGNEPTKLFNYLNANLSKYFHFTISLIAINEIRKFYYEFSNKNNVLNVNLQNEWEDLTCENLDKSITEY